MESMEITLWDYLMNTDLTGGEVQAALSAACETLIRLHMMGCAHNDPHPGNFMRRASDGAWLLIDFGQAGPVSKKAMIADVQKLFRTYRKLVMKVPTLPELQEMEEELLDVVRDS